MRVVRVIIYFFIVAVIFVRRPHHHHDCHAAIAVDVAFEIRIGVLGVQQGLRALGFTVEALLQLQGFSRRGLQMLVPFGLWWGALRAFHTPRNKLRGFLSSLDNLIGAEVRVCLLAA